LPSVTGTSLSVFHSIRVPENVPVTLDVPEEVIVTVISLH
jgi:hypothetical protein